VSRLSRNRCPNQFDPAHVAELVRSLLFVCEIPIRPVEKSAEQIEEERRRKAREDRFKTASTAATAESTNGEGEMGAEKRKLDESEGVEAPATEEPVGLLFLPLGRLTTCSSISDIVYDRRKRR
jgi:hypothetical protein